MCSWISSECTFIGSTVIGTIVKAAQTLASAGYRPRARCCLQR